MKSWKRRPLVVVAAATVLVLAVSLPAMADHVSGGSSEPEGSDDQTVPPEEEGLFGPGGPGEYMFGPEGPFNDDSPAPGAPAEPYCSQPYVLETEWQFACSSHPLMVEQSPDGSSITVRQYGVSPGGG